MFASDCFRHSFLSKSKGYSHSALVILFGSDFKSRGELENWNNGALNSIIHFIGVDSLRESILLLHCKYMQWNHSEDTSKNCKTQLQFFYCNIDKYFAIHSTMQKCRFADKRTDVWSRDFIIWKIDSGLWAVVWAGLWNKRVWVDYEQLLRPIF